MTHDYRVMIAAADPCVQLLLRREEDSLVASVIQCAREFRESCAAVPTEVDRHC